MAKMEHFALFAADPKALADFYVEALGLRIAVDNGAANPPGYFLVDDAGTALEIIGRPAGVEAADRSCVRIWRRPHRQPTRRDHVSGHP